MSSKGKGFFKPVDGIPFGWFALRVLWVAVELILVIWFSQRGAFFFYQMF